MFLRKRLEKHLQFILPELALAGRIQEREVAHVVDEDEAQDGQVGVDRGDFGLAMVGAEGRAEAAEGRGRVERRDFGVDLAGEQFAFEVCAVSISQFVVTILESSSRKQEC